MSTFRILALDGGGIKGTFTAAVLAAWEKHTGRRIADHFNLIAGTSTGGILAIGLGLGLSAAELLEFYTSRGPHIFPVTGVNKYIRPLRQLFRPKFDERALRRELQTAFKDKTLGESSVRLLIPAYDTLQGRIYLFKTRHDPLFAFDESIRAADVALATAAAPTFFKSATIPQHQGQGYVDGGVWANCPALPAVVESLTFLRKQSSELDVLSIGTTYAPDSVRELSGAGLFGWGPRITSLLMNAQAEASRAQAMLLVGRERFLRVDGLTRPGEYTLDSSDEVTALAGLGRAKAVEREILTAVEKRFLNGVHALPFTPLDKAS